MIWFSCQRRMYGNLMICLVLSAYLCGKGSTNGVPFSINNEHIKFFFNTDHKEQENEVFITSTSREKRSANTIENPGQLEVNVRDGRGEISLVLTPNRNLISPFYSRVVRGDDDVIEERLEGSPHKDCFYVGSVKDRSDLPAALSNCDGKGFTGIIVEEDSTHFIRPANSSSRKRRNVDDRERTTDGLHIIRSKSVGRKCAIFDTRSMTASDTIIKLTESGHPDVEVLADKEMSHMNSRLTLGSQLFQKFEIETAVFVDDVMYNYIKDITNNKEVVSTLEDIVFAIMNGVALLYDAPSMKLDIDIVLIYLDIMKKPSKRLDKANGEIMQYLTNFCRWQADQNFILEKKNLKKVLNIWDHAIMITGIELYDRDPEDDDVIGLAWVSGMCRKQYSCTINQGTTFEAVYIITHEMGHNLGMSHDGATESGNNCPKHIHIMSPSTGPGKVTWSVCSNKEIEKFLSSSRYDTSCLRSKREGRTIIALSENNKLPGEHFNMNEQCSYNYDSKHEPYLSSVSPYNNVCRELWCENGTHALLSHPALEGTPCNRGKGMCISGICFVKPIPAEPSAPVPHFPVSENEIPRSIPDNRRSYQGGNSGFRNLFTRITDLFRKYLSLRSVENTVELPKWVMQNLTNCSATCGGGWQSGATNCIRYGEQIEEAYCDEANKPPSKTSCNTSPCFS